MKVRHTVMFLAMLVFGMVICSQSANAVTYQNRIDLNFTIESSLGISLSSADLLIDNLSPGNSAYSNTILVNVSDNGLAGYTLSAKVGDGTTYTNDRLVNTTGSYFTNRASSATLANFSDNEWGYTVASTINSSTTYSGLVYNTDTTINATTNTAGTAATGYTGGNGTNFTIAAKAGTAQASGDYKNVIIFTLISNPLATTYSLTYNKNTNDGVSNMPNNISSVGTTNSTITLSSLTPVREGYVFMGWCTAVVADDATCSGTSYAAGATYSLTAGQANNITLYARWGKICPANSICYIPNPGVSGIEGSMASLGTTTTLTAVSAQAGKRSVSANSTAELIAPNFARSGYGFAGWSTDYEVTSSSTIYGPNETVSTNPQDAHGLNVSNGAVLYPVWVAKETNVTMQTFNSTNYLAYTSAPNGTVIALEDGRDHDVYAVAKLADGQWWMIENLRLDDSATITASNTHNPLRDANDIVTLKIDYANNTVATHLAASNSGTWCNSGDAACDDQTMLNTNNTRISDSSLTPSYSASGATSKWYGYGNYYNWYSATAGNGTYSFSTDNNSVTGDLCPAGWRLPKGGQTTINTTADYYVLTKTLMSGTEPNQNNTNGYGYYNGTVDGVDLGTTASKSLRAYPNNFVYSGDWNGAQASSRSSNGRYWSSSATNSYNAYYLYFYSSNVRPGTVSYSKYYGLSVRCVAGS